MPFGLMGPPPPEDEGLSPLMQAQGMGIVPLPDPTFSPDFAGGNIPSTNNPPWAQQLIGASSTPPQSTKPLEAGVSLMEKKGPSTGSKWLDTLAPILAGAAAVLGYKKDSAGGDVLMGIGKGYAQHLTDVAAEKAKIEHESNQKTVDLAHKYLAELPGDVDAQKYPRLAELGQKMRESLVNGKLSNPKEAQDFILQYTHYKNDIKDYEDQQKYEDEVKKQQAPYEAFQHAVEGARGTDLMAPFMAKHGGLYEDPEHPGRYVPAVELTAREAAKRRAQQDADAMARAKFEAGEREKTAAGNRAAAAARVSTQEAGRNARAKARLDARGGASQKDFDKVYKDATIHARALDKARPVSDPKQMQNDIKDYLSEAGHPPTRTVGGTTYYWHSGRGWSSVPPSGAPSSKVMSPPPVVSSDDDMEEEDNE